MAKFKAFWNYQKKKTGEIVIAEEELQVCWMLHGVRDIIREERKLLLHVLLLKISLRIFLRFRPLQAQICPIFHPISVDLMWVLMGSGIR